MRPHCSAVDDGGYDSKFREETMVLKSEIQCIMFEKRYWKEYAARVWLAEHGLKDDGRLEVTANYLRFRFVDPRAFGKMRTITWSKLEHIKAIVGWRR